MKYRRNHDDVDCHWARQIGSTGKPTTESAQLSVSQDIRAVLYDLLDETKLLRKEQEKTNRMFSEMFRWKDTGAS